MTRRGAQRPAAKRHPPNVDERTGQGGAGRSHRGYDFDDATGDIIGACIEVHRTLGPGFREITYQRALRMELEARGLDFSREEKIPIHYKGKKIDTRRVDFIVEDCLLEIKAKREFDPEDYVQALSYLRGSGYEVGLLVNFGARRAEIKRLVNTAGMKGE